jgi:putative ABC transport system ATP-binding protein
MPKQALIQIQELFFAHADGKPIFSGLTTEIPDQSFTLVRGPSGAGKTTLLRLLCRLEEPVSGSLLFDGKPYEHWPAQDLRRRVHYLQQTPTVIPGDVRTNLLAPFAFKANAGLGRPSDDQMVRGLAGLMLDDVGLDRQAATLSVGQRQRLCLLRAMLLDPRVLLLDEPTSALDHESRHQVEATAEDFSLMPGKAVVMISHNEFAPTRVTPRLLEVNGQEVLEA